MNCWWLLLLIFVVCSSVCALNLLPINWHLVCSIASLIFPFEFIHNLCVWSIFLLIWKTEIHFHLLLISFIISDQCVFIIQSHFLCVWFFSFHTEHHITLKTKYLCVCLCEYTKRIFNGAWMIEIMCVGMLLICCCVRSLCFRFGSWL